MKVINFAFEVRNEQEINTSCKCMSKKSPNCMSAFP